MISLGAHKAINLDGGGSTTFVKKDASGNQQTQNSVSSLRKVSTAIGIVDNMLTGTYAASGTLSSDKDTVLVGDNIQLTAKFYDEYGNDFYVDPGQIRYYTAENISAENGIYSPLSPGTHTLYAQYGDVTVAKSIKAVDDVFSIEIESEDFDLNAGEEKALTVAGYTLDSGKIPISPWLVSWSSSNPAILVTNGAVSTKAYESGTITAELKGKTDSIAINKSVSGIRAPLPTSGNDNMYGNLSSTATVAVTGQIPGGATLLNRFFAHKRLDNLNKYSFAYMIDNYYTDIPPSNSAVANSYSIRTFASTTFITVANTLSAGQLAEICQSTQGSSQNLVLISQSPADSLGKDGERLRSILEKSATNGKNVFWISGGSTTSARLENGIRYLIAGTVCDYKTSSYASDANYCSYILFCINGNSIKYEFVTDSL